MPAQTTYRIRWGALVIETASAHVAELESRDGAHVTARTEAA